MEPALGFRITADGASIPVTMLRTGKPDDALPMSLAQRSAVAAAVSALLPRLAEQHRALVAELELLGAKDIDAVPLLVPSAETQAGRSGGVLRVVARRSAPHGITLAEGRGDGARGGLAWAAGAEGAALLAALVVNVEHRQRSRRGA